MSETVKTLLIVYGWGTVFLLIIGLLCVLRDDISERDRVLGARFALLCPLWPLLLVYGIAVGLRYLWLLATRPL